MSTRGAIQDFASLGLAAGPDEPSDAVQAEIAARIAAVRAEKLEAARNGDPGALGSARHNDPRPTRPRPARAACPENDGPLDPAVERVRAWAESRKGKHSWIAQRERFFAPKPKGDAPVSMARTDPEIILAAGRAIEARGEIVTSAALAAEMEIAPGNAWKLIARLRKEGRWPFRCLKPGQKASLVNGHTVTRPEPDPEPEARSDTIEVEFEVTPDPEPPAPPESGTTPLGREMVAGLRTFCDAIAVTVEAVDHPAHYHAGSGVEVIDAIEAWGLGFAAGNVIKYVSRHATKGRPLEDLKKVRWYLDRLIARLEARS